MVAKIKKNIPNIWKSRIKAFIHNYFDSIHYYLIDRQIFNTEIKSTKHIIFVCKGNICRSAFAEYLMQRRINDSHIKIESCGIKVGQEYFSPKEAIKSAKIFGVELSNHLSKGLIACDFDKADLILAMEYNQYKKLVNNYPKKKDNIKLLRQYSPFPYSLFCNIDDPFGCKIDQFNKCFNLIYITLKQLDKKCLNFSKII